MKRIQYSAVIAFFLLPFYGMAQVQPVNKDTAKAIIPIAKDSSKGMVMAVTPAPPPVQAAADTNIHIHESAVVQNMESKLYQYQLHNHQTSPGFRVQVDFGQEKSLVYKTQSDFAGKYPGVTSYVTYKQPYFRLSVGDFRCKLDAEHFLNKVRKDYPAAFVVADRIVPPPLN